MLRLGVFTKKWKIMSRLISAECVCTTFVGYSWGIKGILNELVAWAKGELAFTGNVIYRGERRAKTVPQQPAGSLTPMATPPPGSGRAPVCSD